jgi:hypothetical protein
VRPTESLALKSVKRLQAKAAKAAAAAPAAQTAQKSARTSKLGMIADISTINSIHAAYIKGGIPTSSQESDEIMDVAFPDERSGSDSKEHQPSAYIRGTQTTADQEASDILGMHPDTVENTEGEEKKAVAGSTQLFQKQLKRLH